MQLVFTVCSLNQLPYAITLGDSLRKHHSNLKFVIGISDSIPSNIPAIEYELVSVEQLQLPFLGEMSKKYTVDELNRSLKPYFASYFEKTFLANKLVFLDSKTWVLGSIQSIFELLDQHSIILSPNITKPRNPSFSINEASFLNAGLYNAGFWAYRPSKQAAQFLSYWQTRVKDKGYFDFCHGFGAEQLWLNFIPIFQDSVHITFHEGFHVNAFNLAERSLSNTSAGIVVNTHTPLAFIQWTDLQSNDPQAFLRNLSGVAPTTLGVLKTMLKEYLSLIKPLDRFGHYVPTLGKYKPYKKKNVLVRTLEKSSKNMIQWIENFEI